MSAPMQIRPLTMQAAAVVPRPADEWVSHPHAGSGQLLKQSLDACLCLLPGVEVLLDSPDWDVIVEPLTVIAGIGPLENTTVGFQRS